MKLTRTELKHLEGLSRIAIDASKEEEYFKKLSTIVDYISVLSKVDTEGIKPTSQVTNLEKGLRDDEVTPSMSQEDVLKNSKHTWKGYFKIPKVIE